MQNWGRKRYQNSSFPFLQRPFTHEVIWFGAKLSDLEMMRSKKHLAADDIFLVALLVGMLTTCLLNKHGRPRTPRGKSCLVRRPDEPQVKHFPRKNIITSYAKHTTASSIKSVHMLAFGTHQGINCYAHSTRFKPMVLYYARDRQCRITVTWIMLYNCAASPACFIHIPHI